MNCESRNSKTRIIIGVDDTCYIMYTLLRSDQLVAEVILLLVNGFLK